METSDYSPFDVVSVPFPFTDRDQTKKRPALVISNIDFNHTSGHVVLVMITSAKNSSWPLDTTISNLEAAGLPSPSVVRMKLFTLDQRFILRKLGQLDTPDTKRVSTTFNTIFSKRIVPTLN